MLQNLSAMLAHTRIFFFQHTRFRLEDYFLLIFVCGVASTCELDKFHWDPENRLGCGIMDLWRFPVFKPPVFLGHPKEGH